MNFSNPNFATVAALSLIFALAAVVRFECARDELWIDEYITAWTVAGSFSESSERASISHQGTLYTWLMFGLTRLFGMSAVSLRGPSVFSGLLLVVASAWLAWQLTKLRSAAILAAFLAAVDPNFVFYSSEARPYALVQLLGLGSAACVWQWRSREASRKNAESFARLPLAIWIGASVAMFYCHFMSVFAIASQALCGWIAALRMGKSKTMWPVATIIVALMGLPGVVELSALYRRAEDWRAFSSLIELLGSLQFSGLMYALPAITGLACAWADHRVRPNSDWSGVLFLLSIALATVAGVVLVTGLGIAPLGHYRYLIAATGLGPALGASYLSAVKRAWIRGIAATALALAAWSQTSIGGNLNQGTLHAPLRWERWSQVARLVNDHSQDEPMPVIVFPNLIEDHQIADRDLGKHQSYFWAPFASLNQIDNRSQVFALSTWSDSRFDSSSLEKIRQARGAWLVIRGGADRNRPQGKSLAASIIDELRTKLKGQGVELIQEIFGPPQSDVHLYRVRVIGNASLLLGRSNLVLTHLAIHQRRAAASRFSAHSSKPQ